MSSTASGSVLPVPAAPQATVRSLQPALCRPPTPISFWLFTRYGLIVTVVTVALVAPYLWLRYLM